MTPKTSVKLRIVKENEIKAAAQHPDWNFNIKILFVFLSY
jgi:hypothetical protein